MSGRASLVAPPRETVLGEGATWFGPGCPEGCSGLKLGWQISSLAHVEFLADHGVGTALTSPTLGSLTTTLVLEARKIKCSQVGHIPSLQRNLEVARQLMQKGDNPCRCTPPPVHSKAGTDSILRS